MFVRMFKVRENERGFFFKDREFRGVFGPGRHWFVDTLRRMRAETVSVRDPWIKHRDLDVIVKSGGLRKEARVIDLKDNQRALIWVNGRFEAVLGPGLHAVWTVFHGVEVEILDVREARFSHPALAVILKWKSAGEYLNSYTVEAGHVALFFQEGEYRAVLEPGTHAFWRGTGKVLVLPVDMRESVLDVAGQEIMTADKVTLRLNAVVTYKVADAIRALTQVEDHRQALYRDAQLALRAVIGTEDLDGLLSRKDEVASALEGVLRGRAASYGVTVLTLGIRDVILPGEMRDLMNRVTEAKKAAEASLITRREETAAMRSQANTAKILESSPMLMRLRELEVLEKVAEKATLKVVLGEGGLADRVVKLL